jgi:hypothetical protein
LIRTPTVFIVGAGASYEYGFPLGEKLVKQIVFHTRAAETPFSKAMVASGIDSTDVLQFSSSLKGADLSSIDAFLENNRAEFVRVGKAAIALVILLAELECAKQGRLIENPPEDNWLKYIWNVARAGCAAQTLLDNRVSFVSFNYDRVLETYLSGVIGSAFNLSSDEAAELRTQAFPVVHLHGQVAGVKFGAGPEAFLNERLDEIAAGIRVVHDAVPVGDSVFEEAQGMIEQAEVICCLGFGYHPTNIKRLRLSRLKKTNARFVGSTFGMGRAEMLQAQAALGLDLTHVPLSGRKCEAFLRENVVLL